MKRTQDGFVKKAGVFSTVEAALGALGSFFGTVIQVGKQFIVLPTIRKTQGSDSHGEFRYNGKSGKIVCQNKPNNG